MNKELQLQVTSKWFEAKGKTLIVLPDDYDLYLFWTMPRRMGNGVTDFTVKEMNKYGIEADSNASDPISLTHQKIAQITDVPVGACLYLTTNQDGSACGEYPAYICFQD